MQNLKLTKALGTLARYWQPKATFTWKRFGPKTATFLLRMHLSYTKTTKMITKTHKYENALQSGNFEMFSSLPFPFPRVNRENATKTHTCFSK